MINKIKVLKTQEGKPLTDKVASCQNVVTQMPLHTQITNWPHTALVFGGLCQDILDDNQLYLAGDHAAYVRMKANEKLMDGMYYDTAAHVEIFANKLNDASLPISMGFNLYAVRKPKAPKTFSARDGNNLGDIFVTYARKLKVDSYVTEIAEVIAGQNPLYVLGGACSITFMVIPNKKPGTDYLIRLAYVTSSGLSQFSDPIPFHTRK